MDIKQYIFRRFFVKYINKTQLYYCLFHFNVSDGSFTLYLSIVFVFLVKSSPFTRTQKKRKNIFGQIEFPSSIEDSDVFSLVRGRLAKANE